MTDSFPRRQARTRRFTLGTPRGVALSPDGARVAFLRSRGGTDAVTCLWSLDVATGQERLVADPRTLEAGSDEDLPPEERARRERAREQAGGIVAYATDRAAALASFALSGRPHVVDLLPGGAPPRPLDAPGPVVDPRPDPTGHRVAYVSGGALHVHDLGSGTTTAVAEPESDTVTYGLADFVAAEEMNRMRGYWWSPDGGSLLVARVDDAPVHRWHIADPANPEREPTVVAYPAAGTPNARVSLDVVGLDGTRIGVAWDTGRDEYLAHVGWSPDELLIVVQPRDQRALRVLRVDPATGATALVHEDTDPHWVEIVPGVPGRTASGALLWITDDGTARRLLADGEPLTPPSLQVRAVLDIDDDTVLFSASDDPVSIALWTWSAVDGLRCLTPEPGIHGGRLAGGTLVVARQSLDADGTVTTVRPAGATERTIASFAEPPGLEPRITLHTAGERALRTALLLPSWHRPGTPLPVLMDPYGGPHAQRVVAARGAHLTSQWFAEQGFAVVVVDGRGTPGRGPAFERAVWGDLAAPVLDDQVDALHALAADHPRPRPDARGNPRLVVRGVPGRAGRAAPTGRLPRRGRRGTGHRLDALRHPLHGALSRPARHAPGRVRPDLAAAGRGEADPPAAAGARAGRRQRGRRAHPAAVVGAARGRAPAQRAAAVRSHPHDAAGGGGGEPAPAAGRVPPRRPRDRRPNRRGLSRSGVRLGRGAVVGLAATPCARRAATSMPTLCAAPAAALHTTNPASAARNIGRRPSASPSRPAGTSASPNVSA